MQFDLRTLLIVQVILYACLGLVCLYLPYRKSGSLAVARWAHVMLMLSAGSAGLAMRGVVPDFISIDLANAVILMAFLFMWRSVRQGGEARGYGPGWTVVGVAVILLWYFTYLQPNTHVRIVISSLATALLVVRPVLTLLQPMPKVRARRFTAFCLAGSGLAMLARALLTTKWGAQPDLLAPDAIQFVFLLAFSMFAVLTTLGIVWIDIEQLQADLVHLAMIDPLTQILNRRAFMLQCEREISRCLREKSALALAIFDLDYFKQVNDTHGHLVGDQVLRAVADRLRASLRGHDVLGRYGGEEFALLMPGADAAAALAATERARLAVGGKPIKAGGYSIPVTLSAGIAGYGADGSDWESLLRCADTALYEAKQGGRSRVVVGHGPDRLQTAHDR